MQSTLEPIRIDESARLKENNERLQKLVGELLTTNQQLRFHLSELERRLAQMQPEIAQA